MDSLFDNLSSVTTTFTHDANGNLSSDGSKTYVYDTENRLVEVVDGSDTVTMRYDPLGRLYEVEDTNGDIRRLYYDGADLVLEYNGTGTMLNRYAHGLSGGDDPLVSYAGSSVALSNARFLYADRLGSIVLSSNQSGSSVTRNAYDDYGMPDQHNGGRFQYTGQAWVPEIGMYYYKARMYSPALGRFMQTDPIGYGDGMNMYAYVGNDPVNGVDPTGLSGLCTTGSVSGIPGVIGYGIWCPSGVGSWDYDRFRAICGFFGFGSQCAPFPAAPSAPAGGPSTPSGGTQDEDDERQDDLDDLVCTVGESAERVGEVGEVAGGAVFVGGLAARSPHVLLIGAGIGETGALFGAFGQLAQDLTDEDSSALGTATRFGVGVFGGRLVRGAARSFGKVGHFLDNDELQAIEHVTDGFLDAVVDAAAGEKFDPENQC